MLGFGTFGAFGAQSAWLSWNVADPSEGVVSYQVFWGTNSGSYVYSDNSFYPNGDFINELVTGQTYYFAVAAVNTNGTVSALSQELVYTVPPPPAVVMQSQIYYYNGSPVLLGLTSSWGISADWDLEYSTDLQNWYPWQAGYGTAGGGNPDFSSWGSDAYFRFVLY